MVYVDVITLFPDMFTGPLNESIIKIAQEKQKIVITIHDLRTYTHDKHKTCDDKPFGGGPGMVMKPEPLFEAIEAIKVTRPYASVIFLTPQGKQFTQSIAAELAQRSEIILLCGHYEGIDDRVRQHLIDEEISIGDFVLTGGELPAMCLIDAMTRLIPGVLGNSDSIYYESFQNGKLDHPHYTRPHTYRGMTVPDVLISGDHKKIEQWRIEQENRKTQERRPDLLT